MKMKTFISFSVWLSKVPSEHRASNNNCQYTVLVRAKTKKRVAELLDVSQHSLRNFHGCEIASPQYTAIPQKDEVIYYLVDHTKNGFVGKWFEYNPQ